LLELNKVYNEDCIGENGMCLINDKSVDMILCDLPYGTTRNKWDSIIPFEILWEQYLRIIKDNGAIVLFGSQPFTSALVMSNPKIFKYSLVWSKSQVTGFLNAKKQPLREHEDILVFYKKPPTYNPQMTKGKMQLKNTGGKTTNYNSFEAQPHYSDEYYPKSILNFPLRRFKGGHPTQKPVELCEYLINTYSNEDEVILDNCMGSFTTAVASKNINRNYIGFELDNTYYEMGRKRLEDLMLINYK